ncbi:UNKNOWN [Stylonychia lemnae]|uniref:Uncharacterized protein n=1 Tax=Stylonychia lemnae TaxID=5949 RepID=A0A078A579_STYLE|nr:UNKNOWN [Stylonychia lemnae]|eukprot:CDW76740.1 UNKNOWN [Stylonychia lemnae]
MNAGTCAPKCAPNYLSTLKCTVQNGSSVIRCGCDLFKPKPKTLAQSLSSQDRVEVKLAESRAQGKLRQLSSSALIL